MPPLIFHRSRSNASIDSEDRPLAELRHGRVGRNLPKEEDLFRASMTSREFGRRGTASPLTSSESEDTPSRPKLKSLVFKIKKT